MPIFHNNSYLPSGMNNKNYAIMAVTVISRFNEEQLWIGLFMRMNTV